jgi:HrpA-like RNA helicase
MLRISLDRLILQLRFMFQGPGSIDNSVLYSCMDPPSEDRVLAAETILTRLGALHSSTNKRGHITWLGQHLAQLPCDPCLGKMLIYGSILQCVSTVSAIAACIATRDPFNSSASSESKEMSLSLSLQI